MPAAATKKLDHKFYPQILDRIVYFSSFPALMKLRSVSRGVQRKAEKYMVEHVAFGTDADGSRALREPSAPFRRLPMTFKGLLCSRMVKLLADVRCIDYYGVMGGDPRQPRIIFPEAVLRQMGPMDEWTNPVQGCSTRVVYQDCRIFYNGILDPLDNWYRCLEATGSTRTIAHVRVRITECAHVPPFTYCYPFDRQLETAVLVLDMYDHDELPSPPPWDDPNAVPIPEPWCPYAPSPGASDDDASDAPSPCPCGYHNPSTPITEPSFDLDLGPHWGFMSNVPATAAKMLIRGVKLEIVGLNDVPAAVLGLPKDYTPAEVEDALCKEIRDLVMEYKDDVTRFGKPDNPTRKPDVAMANLTFDTLQGWQRRADWREAEKPPVPEFWLGWQPDDGEVEDDRIEAEVPFAPYDGPSDTRPSGAVGSDDDGDDTDGSEGEWEDCDSEGGVPDPATANDGDTAPMVWRPRPVDDFEKDWDTELEDGWGSGGGWSSEGSEDSGLGWGSEGSEAGWGGEGSDGSGSDSST